MSAATSFARELPITKAMLGKNVIVEGHIRSQEDLIIEGEVEGTIDMAGHRLTIATNGKVRANVKVREIEVLGSIEGTIEAVEKVYIRKSAQLVGDIHSAGIIVEDGGYIKGNIELSPPVGSVSASNLATNGTLDTEEQLRCLSTAMLSHVAVDPA
jgi:cytoskeletal protein CcmA (bactofilin family)